ncbi:MAG: hypothetical protein WAV10_03115, partial [Minisyncoccia bacterium]
MKKLVLFFIATAIVFSSVRAQMDSLKLDSVLHPVPTVSQCYGSYKGFTGTSGYFRVFYGISNPDSVSTTAFFNSVNGNFVITISGLIPGATYKFIPKETFPIVFDGTPGTFTMPLCPFNPSIAG